jgi:hypothetical protein
MPCDDRGERGYPGRKGLVDGETGMMMLTTAGICSLLAVVAVWRGVRVVKVLQAKALPKKTRRAPRTWLGKYVALIVEPKANDDEVFKYRRRAMWAFTWAMLLVLASQHILRIYLRANSG